MAPKLPQSAQETLDNPNRPLVVAIIKELKSIIIAITAPKPTQKVSLEGAELVTIKGEKGDKGDKGDNPSKEELTTLITPLIPEPIKGDPFTWDDLTSSQKQELKGETGDTPKIEWSKIESTIGKMLPKRKELIDDIKKDIKLPEVPTLEDIVNALLASKRLSYKNLLDVPNISEIIDEYARRTEEAILNKRGNEGQMGSGASALSLLLDTAIQNPQVGDIIMWNGTKWVNQPISSGANIAQQMILPVQSGNDTVFNLSTLPHTISTVLNVVYLGQILDMTRWSIVGNILTIFNTFDSDTFQLQYTYAS